MRIEIGNERPVNFKEAWPGQFGPFSHLDYVMGIPGVLCAITTLKGNGAPNVCFYSGGTFSGDASGYYSILPGSFSGHTGQNISATGEFVINYLSKDYYDSCIATINENKDETDEITAGNFTAEQSKMVSCPRISEAFLCVECKLDRIIQQPRVIIGKVCLAAMLYEYSLGIDKKYGLNGFMLNIANPYNLVAGIGNGDGVAVMDIIRRIEY